MLWTRTSARWLLALATTAVAQNNIHALNATLPDAYAVVALGVENPGDGLTQLINILPLTDAAETQGLAGAAGAAVEVSPDNQINVQSRDIALISCDASDYAGLIDADSVLKTVAEKSVVAIIFYSRQSDVCQLTTSYTDAFDLLYTTVASSDASAMLARVTGNSTTFTIGRSVFATTPLNGNTTSSPSSASSTSNAPPTNQTVAMIVLYSVTGVITLIFLGIIITGAVRAQRHPERYGPRFGPGRPRQSRARGLARAMLDSLPIVKVGDPDEPKHADVELQDSKTTTHVVTTVADEPPSPTALAATSTIGDESNDITAAPNVATVSPLPPAATSVTTEAQGCSICTDDFEVGQDQRVLPCNHRFHPACVDPWLLNVAGTCPLCRIDLRPGQTSTTTGDEAAADESEARHEYFRVIADEQARISRLRAAITTRLTDHRSNRGGRIAVAPRNGPRMAGS